MSCDVGGALNSLSMSKDGSQVVVAGRNGKPYSYLLSLVLICRQTTCNIAAGTAWDTVPT